MKKFLSVVVVLTLILITSSGCYYDNEETLYPTGTCDTTDVKYSVRVTSILTNRCYSCHSISAGPVSGGGYVWEGYANIFGYLATSSSTFLNSINQGVGSNPMPKGSAKLSECDISTIEVWIQDGYPNN